MSAANFAGQPDVFSAEPQIVTHHIGDVTCILMVPAGCPMPKVELTVYRASTTPTERAAAVNALGLSSAPVTQRSGTIWKNVDGDGYQATVFLHEDDPDAQVIA